MKHYVAAVQGIDVQGNIQTGNVFFHSEKLNQYAIKEMLNSHRVALLERGQVIADVKQMMVLSVILLDE